MAHDWLERDDVSVFVVGGVPKGFNRRLSELVAEEHGEEAATLRVNDDLAPWILARVRGEYRQARGRNQASEALWRAFRALAAARYHLRDDDRASTRVKKLRDDVEKLWQKVSPKYGEAAD